LQVVDSHGVALGGFMGTGKSTVGRLLAHALGLGFVDVDLILAERYGPISRQFAEDGEPVFRAREAQVIADLAAGPPAVIATGGGAWVDPANRAVLGRWGRRVVLTAPLDEVKRRIAGDEGRPLAAQLDALYEARAEAYANADLIVQTAGRTPDAVAAEVLAWLRRGGSRSWTAGTPWW
jgi:hypothetical protein